MEEEKKTEEIKLSDNQPQKVTAPTSPFAVQGILVNPGPYPAQGKVKAEEVKPDQKEAGKQIIEPPGGKKKRLCIVGCADSKTFVPYDDPEIEIWGVNNLYNHIPRWTRWFEIHNITFDGKHFSRRAQKDFRGQNIDKYVEDLAKMKCPVYMQRKWENIPGSCQYPLTSIIKRFGSVMGWYNRELPHGVTENNIAYNAYFTNTISYELALAIFEGFEEIQIFGVDMAVDCLSPDTKVLTADLRWVPSGDLKVGDALMGFDEFSTDGTGKTRRWRKTIVTKAIEIMKPCYEVCLDDGTVFFASEKHGWLTHGENINRWKTTDELVTHSHRSGKPTRILKLVEPWKEDRSWEAGYLAAAFDGEGCFMQLARNEHPGLYQTSISFAQRKNEMQATVSKILEKYGFRHGDCNVNGRETVQFNIKGGKPEILRFLGLIRPHRLLPKFKPEVLGEVQSLKNVAVIGTRHVGMQPVIGLQTDTKTFIADGFASHNSEYHHQRPSCEYFLGIAVGLGIKIYMPPESDLLKTRFLYGFQEPLSSEWDAKCTNMIKAMKQRQAQAAQQQDMALRTVEQYSGAIRSAEELRKVWS